MPKRLTIEFIRFKFDREGYNLLTKEYKNCDQKLKYICPNGHRHNISWSNFRCGHRCSYCAGQGKLTIEFIRSEFAKEGYILLTRGYKNNRQKLDYICPEGHKHFIRWYNWKNRQRCPYCDGQGKLTIEFIRSEFAEEGYYLLTTMYINSQQELDYICPKEHKHNITWNRWQQGQRCNICAYIKLSGEGNSQWKGGIACEPYCSIWLDKEFKESIKERDNHQCQNPDCWGTGGKLIGHHIDYNKKNCAPSNIITICDSCNGRANFNREYWQDFYTGIVIKRGVVNV
jgi:hypothetical protein